MINIKRIVAFGCSYTAGEELLYNQLGELDEYRKHTAHDPRLFFQKLSKDPIAQETLKTIRSEQLKLAWPAKLATLLNVDHVNFAEVGNSMDKILWQIEQKKLEKFFQSGDVILVGATNPDRNIFFKDAGPMSFQLPSLYWGLDNSLIGVGKAGDAAVVVDTDADKHLVQWFNNDRIVWDYLKSLKALRSLNVGIVNAMTCDLDLAVYSYNSELFKNIKDSIEYLQINSMDSFAEQNDYLPWGHPKEIIHQKFAESIYEILRKLQTSN
jgi:hypothetical protein